MDSKYDLMGKGANSKVNGSPNKSKAGLVQTTHVAFNSSFGKSQVKRPKLEQVSFLDSRDNKTGSNLSGTTILEQRKALPVYGVRERLLSEVQKYQSVILIGETGSGKTTQVPQFLHEIRLDREGLIGITQPRRVAAITISQRVAREMNTKQGELVGYTVRFEDVTSPQTKLKYLTDGMLLREAMLDKMLMAYSVIILDEAHERTVNTDVLFGIVKQAQLIRAKKVLRPLKIVIMSATMDVDHFSDYFGHIPILYLEGRQYPVKIYHPTEPQDDYLFSSLVTVFQVHKEAPANHDILVFLTGQEEIEAMVYNIRLIEVELQGKYPPLKVYPLYSSLPSHQQLDVFRPTPQGARKIILSTNIAETSVTISGITYVIDCGMVKARTHHTGTGLDMLKVQRISQAQAWQRTGRAGREGPGFCYRVYTKREFDSMLVNTIPEIQRCSLSNVVLQLLALGINVNNFDFMDKPPNESIVEALEILKYLGAIESVEVPTLTPLGRNMAQFPLDPRFSKILLSAKDYGCLDEALSIVALLSSESVFVNSQKKREEALAARQKFSSSFGDHITLLNVFRAYKNVTSPKVWCHENFLHSRNLHYASEVRSQLAELCQGCKIPPSSCGQNTDQLRKCLTTGLFMNIAELQRQRQYITLATRQLVSIHPSSVLFGSQPQYVLFTEVVHTGRCYMRQLSVIDPEWLQDIVPNYVRQHISSQGT